MEKGEGVGDWDLSDGGIWLGLCEKELNLFFFERIKLEMKASPVASYRRLALCYARSFLEGAAVRAVQTSEQYYGQKQEWKVY